MIGLSVRQTQGLFFDRQAVTRAVSRSERRVLSRFGAYVRTGARSSIRPARRKKLSELTPEEQRRHRLRTRMARREGRPQPKLPLAHSRPGEPPRSITGLLRRFLYFAFDPSRRSVVIGPARINSGSGAPQTLEHGGFANRRGKRVRIEARPYMGPALEREEHRLPQLWRDSVR